MCGIFGVHNHNEASNMVYLGLYALQHRGQEGAGIISTDGQELYRIRRQSLVADAFDEAAFEFLKGDSAIGHVRYSTTGGNIQRNLQPFVASLEEGEVSVAHNGNLTNFNELKSSMAKEGAIFHSTMDTEAILHLIARQDKSLTLEEKIAECLKLLKGAFSLLFLNKDKLIAARDPWGLRPLCMGKTKDGKWLFSSETCAFDLLEAQYIRDVKPGEIVVVEKNKAEPISIQYSTAKPAKCVFEHIYFSRPDSKVFGKDVYSSRKNLGKVLAQETKDIKADLVMAVPDSGVLAAMGYAEESKLPFEMGMIRNHYVGRTFIEPKQSIRGFGVKVKLNPVKDILVGKRIVVIDDSIVRGTTSKKIIKMLKSAGASHVSLLISSPPFISPCYYGIDTPEKSDLIASQMSIEELKDYIGADTLHFLSIDGMYKAMEATKNEFCDACFTENYPV
ncbi:MAG TPA: amidophosphoribosyltransferase [Oligoflexia bacterium]|nr:amidophosphoribosyltransferase [Oligoflexia bacterium]HMR23774.1 amidophosphoribosyltransferase [Oligoflexia bacterium]